MPPLARAIGLILLLMNPACLFAQAVAPGPHPNQPDRRWEQPRVYGQREMIPQRSGAVIQAGYERKGASRVEPSNFGPGQPSLPYAHAEAATPAAPPGSVALPQRNLPLPSHDGPRQSPAPSPAGGLRSLVSVASSLAVVLGLFFVVAWVMRRATPGGSAMLPGEVVEVLGRTVVSGRQQLQLLRCGNKLLLVSVTPTGVETLTEITEPDEVNHLAGLCRQAHPDSASATFRQVFQHFSGHQSEGNDV